MTTPVYAVSAATPFPIPVGGGVVLSGAAQVFGWSVKESSGTATAELWLIDGNDGTGQPFAFLTLGANESVRDLTGAIPIKCRSGVFARLVSGVVLGAVWLADVRGALAREAV